MPRKRDGRPVKERSAFARFEEKEKRKKKRKRRLCLINKGKKEPRTGKKKEGGVLTETKGRGG